MKHRILSIALSLVMSVSMLSGMGMTVLAQEEPEENAAWEADSEMDEEAEISTEDIEANKEDPGVIIDSEHFPDAVFREELLKYERDTNHDGYLSEGEIKAITELDLDSSGLTSLVGIEYLTSLTTLKCSHNNLTKLDLSHNTELKEICCYYNAIEELNVRNCSKLEKLYCHSNKLTNLDVSNNTELTTLNCNTNNLSELNLNNNIKLSTLTCGNNNFYHLDLRKLINLEYLDCHNDKLTELDVSYNKSLLWLGCANNNLTTLDISNNVNLELLEFYDNKLACLDLSCLPNIQNEEQSCYIDVKGSTFDVSGYSGFDASKVKKTEYMTFDGKAFQFAGGNSSLMGSYEYDCGNNNTLTVWLTFDSNASSDDTKDASTDTKFSDVQKGKFYYDAVLWAVDKGITTGTSATTFSPNDPCNRAQVVTFLWRAYGKPEPSTTSSPFSDVQDSSKYYYKAVLWAAESGITTGTSSTTFSPDDTVTRGQFVTFLYRAAGKPEVSGSCKFADVEAGKFYYTPVIWAASLGVTTGTSDTTFSPNDSCTRGQVVTFIYRAMK